MKHRGRYLEHSLWPIPRLKPEHAENHHFDRYKCAIIHGYVGLPEAIGKPSERGTTTKQLKLGLSCSKEYKCLRIVFFWCARTGFDTTAIQSPVAIELHNLFHQPCQIHSNTSCPNPRLAWDPCILRSPTIGDISSPTCKDPVISVMDLIDFRASSDEMWRGQTWVWSGAILIAGNIGWLQCYSCFVHRVERSTSKVWNPATVRFKSINECRPWKQCHW